MPPLLFLDIFGDSTILDFACVSSSMDAPIVDHSQNTKDDSPSFNNGEDKSFIKNPLYFSSPFSRNAEGEHNCFPQRDSSYYEDAEKHLEFSDLDCHDLFTSSSGHDVDSLVVNLSKALVSDDLSIDEVGTPQAVKAI